MEVKMKWVATCWNLGGDGHAKEFIQLFFVLLDRFQISRNIYLFYQISTGGRKPSVDVFNSGHDFGWIIQFCWASVSYPVKWSRGRWNEKTQGQHWAQCLARGGRSARGGGQGSTTHSSLSHRRCREQAGEPSLPPWLSIKNLFNDHGLFAY